MNDNKLPKRFYTLSKQLSNLYEHMDEIDATFVTIEAFVDKEYENIEKRVNPDLNNDISKELKYHMTSFLKDMASKYNCHKLSK